MNGIFELSPQAANVKKLIEEKIKKQAVEASFFAPLEGSSEGSIVQVGTDLEKSDGATITHTLLKELKGEGVEGDEELEGKEEGLEETTFTTGLQLYRHATKVKGGLTYQYDAFNMPTQAQEALKRWMTRKIDSLRFAALYNAPTNVAYGGTATTLGTLDATTSKITPTFLRKLMVRATTGDNGKFDPLVPVMYKGKEYLIYVTHPEVVFDLKEDTTMQQYLIHAQPPGWDNPLFSGADLIVDGIVIKSSKKVPIANNGGAGAVPYCKSLLLGGGSLLWSWGKRPSIIPEVRDYGRIKSFAIEMIAHADKPKFDIGQGLMDFGSMVCITSRTKVV